MRFRNFTKNEENKITTLPLVHSIAQVLPVAESGGSVTIIYNR